MDSVTGRQTDGHTCLSIYNKSCFITAAKLSGIMYVCMTVFDRYIFTQTFPPSELFIVLCSTSTFCRRYWRAFHDLRWYLCYGRLEPIVWGYVTQVTVFAEYFISTKTTALWYPSIKRYRIIIGCASVLNFTHLTDTSKENVTRIERSSLIWGRRIPNSSLSIGLICWSSV